MSRMEIRKKCVKIEDAMKEYKIYQKRKNYKKLIMLKRKKKN